jgi:hypothetical protein
MVFPDESTARFCVNVADAATVKSMVQVVDGLQQEI